MTSALALCRFVHFLAASLAFGACAYLQVCAPARLRVALAPTALRCVRIAAAVALAAASAQLLLEAAAMADRPRAALDRATVVAVLTETAFGRAWAAVLALGAAFLVAALLLKARWGGAALLAALALASLALVGHTAMPGGALGALHRANDMAHLIAGGAWIGGLPLFAASLRASERAALRRVAIVAMVRFSFYGHFVVAAVVATGVINIALTSGVPLPPMTPYRALLTAKVAVVAVMVALALVNRYALVPRLRAAGMASAIRTITLANVGLGCVVTALVSLFGLLDPGPASN